MVGNPQRYRAALQQLENRHATAGCLLSALFVIPILARTYNMATLAAAALFYVAVVVPLAAGFTTPGHLLAKLRMTLIGLLDARTVARYWARQARLLLVWAHRVYCHLDSIHTTTTQVLFFLMAEKVLCPTERMACLYVLLFYTVIAYLQRSLHTRQWTQLLHENSTADFLKLTTAFIVVRLGKGVAMSMVLLTFTLQFNHLEPSLAFVVLTATYFLLTQYGGAPGEETLMVTVIRAAEMQVLEGMEELWVPLLVHGAAVAMSVALLVAAVITQWTLWPLCLLVGYTNVYVAGKHTFDKYWMPLSVEQAVMAGFPIASLHQMKERGDGPCPICLDDMGLFRARITPCGHIFHGLCLRRCVQHFGQCPLCKQSL